MGFPSRARSRRRSAGQLHALASLQRELRAADPNGRRRYLRDFSEAFRDYESLLTLAHVEAELCQADVVLVGDYHALPTSQRFASQILERIPKCGRPVVLGLETIFARDQHILDEWVRGEIDDGELRERIRFDLDWGYDWEPFRELLVAARQHTVGVYGLDCMPRDDLRKIARRDRHAAQKIAEIARRHPNAIVVVLFGESHLAPNHIPEVLRVALPDAGVLTLLQNIDHLYWRAAGERHEHVEAVRVESDVLCVFNATPLEKYESYRQCIERWREEHAAPDLAPTFYNLVDALARFLHIDKYAAHNGTQPVYLVDRMPEVYSRPSDEAMCKLLERKGAGEEELKEILARIESGGCCYVPRLEAIFVREFQMVGGAEEAARFVHHACRPATPSTESAASGEPANREELFYTRVVEHALGYFGSRLLYPARPAVRDLDLGVLSAQPQEAVEEQALFTGARFAFATERLGYMLGSELYDAYLAGRLSKRYIRSLFFRKLNGSAARGTYLQTVRKARATQRKGMA
ncbi:MAG TPA: ChaN family lipoprotein [Terriglobales bacterium]|nr:ChaN family lipoprotein [Terriglobales bacterium]